MPRALLAAAMLLVAASAGPSPPDASATQSSAPVRTGPSWREVPWPFPRDAWSPGRAFRCQAPSCGGDVEVFVRTKRGLCANCDAGVTGDWEVDAAGDLDTMSADFVPGGAGEPVALAGLRGRRRAYVLRPAAEPAVAAVVSRPGQCDLLVVASRGPGSDGAPIHDLMDDPAVRAWIEASLRGE